MNSNGIRSLTAQELLGLSSEQAVMVDLERERRCVRCAQSYKELGNMGAWLCKAYHPMEAFRTFRQSHYNCCGQAVGVRGCVPVDHTDCYEYEVTPVLVSESVSETIGAARRNKNWTLEASNGRWYVQRLDAVAFARCTEQAHKVDASALKRPIFV